MMESWELPMESQLSPEEARELDCLQTELVRLQSRVKKQQERVLIIFEGRDTAGKGGAILRFRRYLDPRFVRTVALPKPTEYIQGQWFFQRYIQHLPSRGEIVLFDRSWYNRAIVEPVLGFCTPQEHERFMKQVPIFERLLTDDGIKIIKLWFSIDRETQKQRLNARKIDVRRQWKLSPVDGLAQQRWDKVTEYKNKMYRVTHTEWAPWTIVRGVDKYKARTESMRYVLRTLGMKPNESCVSIDPDPDVVFPWNPDFHSGPDVPAANL